MTIGPSICEIDSSTVSRMGCENVTVMPGTVSSVRSISASTSRLRRPDLHGGVQHHL